MTEDEMKDGITNSMDEVRNPGEPDDRRPGVRFLGFPKSLDMTDRLN